MTRSVEIPDEAADAAWTAYSRSPSGGGRGGMRAALLAALPHLAPAGSGIQMVDIAAEAREMYGEHADEIAGRKLPDHEWRFELLFSDGARATMHHGATADDVQAYLAMMRNEGRTLQSTPAAPAVPQPASEDDAHGGTDAFLSATLERFGLPSVAGLTGLMRHLENNRAMSEGLLHETIRILKERSAVPQPVDREALARWLYEHYDPRGNGTGQHWPWGELSQQTKDQYGQQADAVLAVLAGEQEQVEP